MRSIAVIVALAVGGCGIAMTQKPDPRAPASERPKCTEYMTAPKQDMIGVAIGAVLLLYGAISLDTAGNEALATPLLVGGAITTGGSLASAAIGRSRVKKCRTAIAAYEAQQKATPPPPPPAPPPPPPPLTEPPPPDDPFNQQ